MNRHNIIIVVFVNKTNNLEVLTKLLILQKLRIVKFFDDL